MAARTTAAGRATDVNGRNLYSVALKAFALAACLLVFFSCFSFSIWDAPSRLAYPNNDPTANWCGSIGAFAAYYLMYYIGPGVLCWCPLSPVPSAQPCRRQDHSPSFASSACVC